MVKGFSTNIDAHTQWRLGLNISDLTHNRGKASIVNLFANSDEIQKKSSKGGKVKSSQGAQPKNQPQPSTSSQATSNTWRPLVHCSACGGDHLHKDCHCDTFCTKCRSRSHNTEMCHAPTKTEKENNICIYCGSKSHSSGRCTSRPNDNREEPRSTPRDLQDHRTGNTGSKNCLSIKTETLITKQGLMKDLTGNTRLIIIIFRLLN